ncbi:T-cell immunoglobulin and mucin domain-containing protein 4-like isoform X3 [Rana temporaria]|nr:T-cell immunoglobulin and mucin domain-containing protein 4-like isoform X3 [Rana temporaria]
MCWGRGDCTSVLKTYCNNVIIKTDGSKLTEKTSNRYQLLGNIEQGNVSLTITNVTKEDEGIYCCRVAISGWFNDKKNIYNVKVQERDKSDASTESNDRDKQEGTSDPPVTEAGDPLCSENHDDDKSPTSVYTSLTPISPMKITPPPNAEAQSIKRVLHILLHILTMIAIPFTAVIVYKCKVKDKTPSTSAVSMAKLAASETDGGEP